MPPRRRRTSSTVRAVVRGRGSRRSVAADVAGASLQGIQRSQFCGLVERPQRAPAVLTLISDNYFYR